MYVCTAIKLKTENTECCVTLHHLLILHTHSRHSDMCITKKFLGKI